MGSSDGGAGVLRTGGADHHQQGFSLVEVLVAMVVLLVVLLPVGDLLITSGSVIANSRFRTQAQGIASQALAAVQLLAQQQPSGFTTVPFAGLPDATPPVASPTTSGGTVQWNQSAPVTTQTVDHEQYTVAVDGGWCAVRTSGSSTAYGMGTGTTPPASLAFVVAVDVLWDHTTLASGSGPGTHYVLVGTVAPVGGWTGLPPGGLPATDVADCPAGLS